jgi:nitrite reductase/ring-hydroxylating ferredoxin subunit
VDAVPEGEAAGVSGPPDPPPGDLPRLYATPAGVALGPVDLVPDGGARSFVLEMRAGRFHGFVVRRGDRVHGYADRCPHAGLPLAQRLDDYLTPDRELIACSWHSALFDVETGICRGGPCVGAKLTPWPVEVREGRLVTASPPRDEG